MTAKIDESDPQFTAVIRAGGSINEVQECVGSLCRFVARPMRIAVVASEDWAKNNGSPGLSVSGDLSLKFHFHSSLWQAVNEAIRTSMGHVLFLESDVRLLRPGTVERLLDVLAQHPQVGAVGPTTDIGPGAQSVERNLVFPEVHEVHWLSGACLLLRDQAVRKIDGFDASRFPGRTLFTFFDLALRIRKAGYQVVCCRSAFVHQFGDEDEFRDVGNDASQNRSTFLEKWGKAKLEALLAAPSYSQARVLVMIPVYSSVSPEAYANHILAWTREVRQARPERLAMEFSVYTRSNLVYARNQAANQAMRDGFSHLFFMDDDVLVPEGALQRLVDHGYDVVSGLCRIRQAPYPPAMFLDPKTVSGQVAKLRSWPRNRIIEVDAVGCACLLVRTSVFRRLAELDSSCPFFAFDHARDGECSVGEDIYFSKRAKDAGYKIFVDTGLEFGHLAAPVVLDSATVEAMGEHHPVGGIDYETYEQATRAAEEAFLSDVRH